MRRSALPRRSKSSVAPLRLLEIQSEDLEAPVECAIPLGRYASERVAARRLHFEDDSSELVQARHGQRSRQVDSQRNDANAFKRLHARSQHSESFVGFSRGARDFASPTACLGATETLLRH